MKNKVLSVAFFGSPDFSASILKKLLSEPKLPLRISLIYTQPDKPVGRKKMLTPTPVKLVANEYKIPCLETIPQPEELKKHHIDLGIVYAYGLILPKTVLEATTCGFWNIHPSLLPLYRGPSPVAYPLLLGDKTTGCSLIEMDEQLDHGPILAQETISILPNDNRESLTYRLSDQGYSLLRNLLVEFTRQSKEKTKHAVTNQDHQKATYTKRFRKNDGFIEPNLFRYAQAGARISKDQLPLLIRTYIETNMTDLNNDKLRLYNAANIVQNMYKGLYKWPGIWTYCTYSGAKKRLKILDLDFHDNKLRLKSVQIEGKTATNYDQLSTSPLFSIE